MKNPRAEVIRGAYSARWASGRYVVRGQSSSLIGAIRPEGQMWRGYIESIGDAPTVTPVAYDTVLEALLAILDLGPYGHDDGSTDTPSPAPKLLLASDS